MSYLVFDIDRSLATIGGAEGVEQLLGLPPLPISRGIPELNQYLNKILTVEEAEVSHPLMDGDTKTERRIVPNTRGQEIGLDGLIIDTATTLGQQQRENVLASRRESTGKDLNGLDQQGWGRYGRDMMKMWGRLSQTELVVIVNAHVKLDRDDVGQTIEVPGMKGSSATEMLRYFDVVLYNVVSSSDGDESSHKWVTRPGTRRPAKDRRAVLEPSMPQDFSQVITRYRDGGVPNPKILVVGESGSGKTYALQTLAPLVD